MKNDRDKKILILGGSSYVGTHLLARLGSKGAIATYYKKPIDEGVYFDALTMDLRKIIQEPGALSCVLILLGDTDPESCAKDPKRSYALNVDSIKRIIDYLKRNQIKPIFASSEFIFDGKKGGYVEDDEPNPILTYGKQKVEVERYLQKTCNDHIILRFAKIYGSQPDDGTLFTNWISEINKADTIRCASDQIFSSIYIDDLVESIMRIIEGDHTGIFHVAGNKAYARIELLQMLLREMRKYFPVNVEVLPCSIHDFNLSEKRPLNVSMVPRRLIEATGIRLHDVETVCREIARKGSKEYEKSKKSTDYC